MFLSDYGSAHLHLHDSHMQAMGVDIGFGFPQSCFGNAPSTTEHDLSTSVTQEAHALLPKEGAAILRCRLSPQNLNLDRIIKRLKFILLGVP